MCSALFVGRGRDFVLLDILGDKFRGRIYVNVGVCGACSGVLSFLNTK